MSNLILLKAEIEVDTFRVYSTMDNKQVADSLNTVDRTRNRTSMTATEVYNAIDQTEWAGLTALSQQEIWDILHLGDLNPFGREKARFLSIFGAGDTITALNAARTEDVSRAVEINIGFVREGDVEYVRNN